jgi:hypothetical protein
MFSPTPLPDALFSPAHHHPAPSANKCVAVHPALRRNKEPCFEIIASIVGMNLKLRRPGKSDYAVAKLSYGGGMYRIARRSWMLDQAWIGEELEYILKTYFQNGPKLSRKLLAISGLSFGYRFRIAGAQFPQQNDLPLSASKCSQASRSYLLGV